MSDESLITESMRVQLGLERRTEKEGSTALPRESEFVAAALRAICECPLNTIVLIGGRANTIVRPHEADPTHGTQILHSQEDGRMGGQIVLSPCDQPRQWVQLDFELRESASSSSYRRCLEIQFNPTTLFSGNNVMPVTIADPLTGALPPYPSSSPSVMRPLNRAGFVWLEEVFKQVTNSDQPLFSKQTQKAIDHGHFEIVRAQHCVYLPTPDISVCLQMLCIMCAQTIASDKGIIDLASHLGLKFEYWTHANNYLVTGVMFTKRHGTKIVHSAAFYNKRKRISQMQQGKTLTKIEADTIDNNVRFDMTSHPEGIKQTIKAAQNHLIKLRETDPDALPLVGKKFVEDKPSNSAWWWERAVYVLSHVRNVKRIERKSFANWLVPKIIKHVLKLDRFATYTSANLQVLADLDDPIAKGWREVKEPGMPELIKHLKIAGVKKSAVYERRKLWKAKFHIDIGLPYQLYVDQVYYGSHSLALPKNRAALNAAVGQENGAEALRLLINEAENFDGKRLNIVGATINSEPLMMSAKVVKPLDSSAMQLNQLEKPIEQPTLPMPEVKDSSAKGRAVIVAGESTVTARALPKAPPPVAKSVGIAKAVSAETLSSKAPQFAARPTPANKGLTAMGKPIGSAASPPKPLGTAAKPLGKPPLPGKGLTASAKFSGVPRSPSSGIKASTIKAAAEEKVRIIRSKVASAGRIQSVSSVAEGFKSSLKNPRVKPRFSGNR